MANSISQFNSNIRAIEDLTSTIDQIDRLTTTLLDISDLYRSQIVMAVSALDHFVHEFVLEEMLEIYNGRRLATPAFAKFPIPISSVLNARPSDDVVRSHIRQKHSWLSFQDPDKIAEAVRLISEKKLWEEVSPRFSLSAGDLKAKIKIVIDRRNRIAHELDMDPSFPGRRWPISITDVSETTEFLSLLVNEIYHKIK